jgi:hypothetical protein
MAMTIFMDSIPAKARRRDANGQTRPMAREMASRGPGQAVGIKRRASLGSHESSHCEQREIL